MNLLPDNTYCRVPSIEVQDAMFRLAESMGLPVVRHRIVRDLFTGYIGYTSCDTEGGDKLHVISPANYESAELDTSALRVSLPEFLSGMIEEAKWWHGPYRRPEINAAKCIINGRLEYKL